MEQWDQAQKRGEKAARGLEGQPWVKLISILLIQEPEGCLGTAQEYLTSLREQGRIAEGCATLSYSALFLKLLFGLC